MDRLIAYITVVVGLKNWTATGCIYSSLIAREVKDFVVAGLATY